MPTEVVMPRLSDTMESGTIGRWLKQEGDPVKRGEIIAEIETDKANMEMESYANGVLARIVVREGESALIGAPIAIVAKDAAEAETVKSSAAAPASAQPAQSPASPQPDAGSPAGPDPWTPEPPQGQPAPGTVPGGASTEPSDGPQAGSNGRIKASPLARRLAQESGLQLGQITGTGPGGRITKADVQAFVRSGPSSAPAASPLPAAAPLPSPGGEPVASGRAPQPVQMTRMQNTIARRMTEARFSKPDFVLTAEYDLTEAQALLRTIKSTAGAPRVGPNDLLIKACALALRRNPDVNAGWENDTITRYGRVNVGFAVSIEGGLVVPVVQDADRKPLGQIAGEAKGLIDKARSGKIHPSEYEHGTFSISNLGMYGIDQFTPIINPPEACILGVGSITPTPVVVNGEVVIRDRMKVSLACDHRVINGSQGAEFLQTLRGLLENPVLALL